MRYQKFAALAAAAALTAVLAGCVSVPSGDQGQQDPGGSQSDTQQQTQGQTQGGAADNPFAGSDQTTQQPQDSQQVQTVDLTVNVNGQEQTVTAAVYTGSGYTIAVPEGWEQDHNEPQWNPYHVDDVELTVRYYTGMSAADILPCSSGTRTTTFLRRRRSLPWPACRTSPNCGAAKWTTAACRKWWPISSM